VNEINIENELNKAADLISAQKLEAAIEVYNNILETSSNNFEAIKGLGLCFHKQDKVDLSIEQFEKAIKICPDDATSYFYLASIYTLQSKWEQSENLYKKVIQLRPNYIDAYKNLALIYLKLKKADEAIKFLLKAFEINSTNPAIVYILGTIYMSKGNFNDALNFLEKSILLNPEEAQAYNNLGTCYMAIKDYEKALNTFKKALELAPDNGITYSNIATLYQMKNNFEEAIHYYQKALEISPENIFTQINFANVCFRSKKYLQAVEIYEQILKTNPRNHELRNNLIVCYLALGKAEHALSEIDKLITQNPHSLTFNLQKAKILTDLNHYEEAHKIYLGLLKHKKISPVIYHNIGLLNVKMKNYDEALGYLKKALSLNADNGFINKDIGVIYLMRHQLDYAQIEFDQAVQKNPDSWEICFEYANFSYLSGHFDKSLEYYRKAINLKPFDADLKIALGICLIATNRLDEAFATLEPLLLEKSEDTILLYNIGRIYYAKNEYDNAINVLEKAYNLLSSVEIANVLAMCFKQKEMYNEAIELFKKILTKYPMNSIAWLELGDCYKKSGEIEKAENTYLESITAFPAFEEAIIALANIYYEKSETDKAKEILEKGYENTSSEQIKLLLEEKG
jgi:tetratricopeptide (TPR) repeat protein